MRSCVPLDVNSLHASRPPRHTSFRGGSASAVRNRDVHSFNVTAIQVTAYICDDLIRIQGEIRMRAITIGVDKKTVSVDNGPLKAGGRAKDNQIDR